MEDFMDWINVAEIAIGVAAGMAAWHVAQRILGKLR
jgi:hypothetical protein